MELPELILSLRSITSAVQEATLAFQCLCEYTNAPQQASWQQLGVKSAVTELFIQSSMAAAPLSDHTCAAIVET